MKKQSTKTLFAIIAIIMIFAFNSANGQIISTDVNPDIMKSCSTAPCSNSYKLDLNNDGIVDFNLDLLSSKPNPTCCAPFNDNFVFVTPLNANAVSGLKLGLNTIIGANTTWNTSRQPLASAEVSPDGAGGVSFKLTGDWGKATDGYLALKVIINSKVYFGWARLAISAPFCDSFTIKDYGYNSKSDQPIKAGNQNLSTDNFTQNTNFIVYPNPFSDYTNISFSLNQPEKVSMRIIDLNGRLIKNLANSYLDAGHHLIQCNTENLNAGIYFLQIQAGETLKTEKLIVTN